jgi:DNA-binding NtrC family response regulator
MSRILVVDDAAPVAEQYRYDLERLGQHEVTVATGGIAALARIEHQAFDCVILDLEMPEMDGFEVLEALQHRGVDIPVIVYTGTGDFDRCVRAVRLGASGFVDKAEPMERVVLEVAQAIERARLRREVGELRRRLGESTLVGRSPAMGSLRAMIERLGPLPATVLILGESGTGKELVAREIHRLGPNPGGPLVPINCAALPESLAESELFGHEKGAFTGAVASRKGAFEAAAGGTLFLDEIGELPLTLQPKFLRVLEQRTVTPVGSTRAVPVTPRVVAATHRDLDQAVRDGTFRADLLFRLNAHRIMVPPLRERPEDIVPLAERLLEETCHRFGLLPKRFSGEAAARLTRHGWRGNNVRELRNVVEWAAAMADGEVIRLEDLPTELGDPAGHSVGKSFQAQRAEAERRIVTAALAEHDGQVGRAAAALGLADHASLLKIMRRLGLSSRGRSGPA